MPLTTILIILAVYRITNLIVYEDGPADIFTLWRGWLFDKLGEGHWIYRGFNCPMCVSFWLSLAAIWALETNPLLAWLGCAGAVALLFRIGDDQSEIA